MSIIREADDKYEFFYPVYKKACWLVSATKWVITSSPWVISMNQMVVLLT